MTAETDTLERTPPQAVDVEQSVLGAMLMEKDAIGTAIEILGEDSFYRDTHRNIFVAMTSLYDNNAPVDLITLSEELTKRNQLEDIGGRTYLVTLTELVASAANIKHHCNIVLKKATARQLQTVTAGVAEDCYDDTIDPDKLLDDTQERLSNIAEGSVKQDIIQLGDVLFDSYQTLKSKEHVTGLPTGFPLLDHLMRGCYPGQLIIIGGRPSMGKTSFVLNTASNVATGEKPLPVGIFSLETTGEALGELLLSARARVSLYEPKEDEQLAKLAKAFTELETAPIFIDDSPTLTPLEIKAKARRLKSSKDIKLLIVDYLQLITVSQYKERRDQVGYASRCLKQLAKELDIPIIALSQLSRACENRPDKRPQLVDLRETGEIEQDADVVFFIYRPSRYEGLKIKMIGEDTLSLPPKEYAEVIIRKQKKGPVGSFELFFHEEYTRFDNVSKREEV